MDALASPQYKDDPQPADAAVARESEAIVVAATLKIRDTITHLFRFHDALTALFFYS